MEKAVNYCHSIGADPYEKVRGCHDSGLGYGIWCIKTRWMWYLGVSEEGLRRPVP